MPRLLLRICGQCEIALPDDNFIGFDFDCLGTQIGGKAVFFSVQKYNADDSGEMNPAQRDIRDGEYQRATQETALGPHIFAGKRIPPVAFQVTDGILEHIWRAIDGKRPIHRVVHAANAVLALHKRHISERPHDVILDWRKWAKPNGAGGMEVRHADVQHDAFSSKLISRNGDLIALLLKIRVGEWNKEGLRIGYQLYGTVFGLFGSVNGWNDGKCLLL